MGRKGKSVAEWILERANERGTAIYELVDILDFGLPHLNETEESQRARPHQNLGGNDRTI